MRSDFLGQNFLLQNKPRLRQDALEHRKPMYFGKKIAVVMPAYNAAQTLRQTYDEVREQGIVEIVVGLPVEARGNEGEMAAGARLWAAEMATRLNLPVVMRDERLSSFVADQRLGRMPRGRSGGAPSRTQRDAYKARVDREAASVILQDELDARHTAAVANAAAGTLPGAPEDRR